MCFVVEYWGLRQCNNFEKYASLEEWDELGSNTTGNHLSGYSLLVVPKNSKIQVSRIPQHAGIVRSALDQLTSGALDRLVSAEVRYALDQRRNPDTVSFLPGGVYNEQQILVCGHIGTASESPISIDLYKAFAGAVTKGFERIGAYRVGPEAIRLMDEGYRMVTIGIGSPREYDLRRGVMHG